MEKAEKMATLKEKVYNKFNNLIKFLSCVQTKYYEEALMLSFVSYY